MKAPVTAKHHPSSDGRAAQSDAGTPDPRDPASFPRRILLAVTGLSPQIVTETVYALAVKPGAGRGTFIPTEIQLITTSVGRKQALDNLLGERGWFHRLCADYQLPEIRFDGSCIHVMARGDGQPLDDIRSLEDSELVADLITERVRELTSDAGTALHVSLAGGRKTMGFYLGYALSLFGRPQDRLSHVLVSSPYESHQNFYYPPRNELLLEVRNRPDRVDARNAEVVLAEIPIVYLRDGLPQSLLTGKASFNVAVTTARDALAPAELLIDVRTQRVRAGTHVFKLPAGQFAMLAVFAYRASRGRPPLRAPVKDLPDEDWSQKYRDDLQAAYGEWDIPDRVAGSLKAGVNENYFSQQLSRLTSRLNSELGPAAKNYRIDVGGEKRRLYQLVVPAERIKLGEIDPTCLPADVPEHD